MFAFIYRIGKRKEKSLKVFTSGKGLKIDLRSRPPAKGSKICKGLFSNPSPILFVLGKASTCRLYWNKGLLRRPTLIPHDTGKEGLYYA
jgi:hypothetical protein